MIKSVKGLKIGDEFEYGGIIYQVTSFPTRSYVYGINPCIVYDQSGNNSK